MAKSSYHHGNLREALLAAAVEQVEAHGVEGFRLSAACRAVGVTHAAAYKHFKDRTALLGAVSDAAMAAFGEALTATMAAHDAARDQYLASGRAVVAFARARPQLYRLAFGEARRDDPGTLAQPPPGTVLHAFVAMIAEWQDAGWLAPADPTDWALVLWTSAHGLALLVASGRIDASAAEAEAMSDAVLMAIHAGIGARVGSGTPAAHQ